MNKHVVSFFLVLPLISACGGAAFAPTETDPAIASLSDADPPPVPTDDAGRPLDDAGNPIPQDDAGTPSDDATDDAGNPLTKDSGSDTGSPGSDDAGNVDSGNPTPDAGTDSGSVETDAGKDSGSEGSDAGKDSGSVETDAGKDSGSEGSDAGSTQGSDAGKDSGSTTTDDAGSTTNDDAGSDPDAATAQGDDAGEDAGVDAAPPPPPPCTTEGALSCNGNQPVQCTSSIEVPYGGACSFGCSAGACACTPPAGRFGTGMASGPVSANIPSYIDSVTGFTWTNAGNMVQPVYCGYLSENGSSFQLPSAAQVDTILAQEVPDISCVLNSIFTGVITLSDPCGDAGAQTLTMNLSNGIVECGGSTTTVVCVQP